MSTQNKLTSTKKKKKKKEKKKKDENLLKIECFTN